MVNLDGLDLRLRHLQEAGWLLLALVTPLFVNFWVEQQFEASKIWLLRTLVWALALLWFGRWLWGGRLRTLPAAVRNLVIALLLVLVLATFLSPTRYIALFGSLDRANGFLTQLTYLVLFLCVATQITVQGGRTLLHVVVLTAVPICLLGLAQAAGWQPLPVLTDARSQLTTTLGRANFTGAYLAMVLPITVTAVFSAGNKWGRLVYGTLALVMVTVIALTGARAAWLAAVAGVGVLLWLCVAPRWSTRGRLLSAMAGIMTFGGVLVLVLQRGIEQAGSIAARWTIWQASLRLLWPRLWLGTGADTLELYFPAVYPPELVYYQGRGVVVDRAHNWLLDWSLNYGVVATVLFIALIAVVLLAGWRLLSEDLEQSSEQSLQPYWLAACIAGICAQLVGNLFLFEVAATTVLFWLLLAIVTAPATRAPLLEGLPPRLPIWLRLGVIAAGIMILGWAVWQGNVRPLIADGHGWQGTRALSQGNAPEALAAYRTAAEEQPQRADYQIAVALTAAQVGNFDQAEQAMAKGIALRPEDPVPLTHLAAIFEWQATESVDSIELAYDAYERAVALAPTIALTHQQYAATALRMGDIDLAAAQAQAAVQLDATDGLSYGVLGWAYLQAGNPVAAEDAFKLAVKWQPDSAEFFLGLATASFELGNVEAAQQAVAHSLQRAPAYAPALALQQQLAEE